MRLALHGLAFVLVAGLGVALPFSSAQMKHGVRQAAVEQVVFVDKGRLARLHPAWDAVQEMRKTLAQVQQASNLAGARMVGGGVSSRLIARGAEDKASRSGNTSLWISRQQLETEAARAAMRAYQQSDSDAREALAMRLGSMKAIMMSSAEASRMAKTLEIESEATRSASEVDRRYMPGRLNAQLKMGALQSVPSDAGIDSAAVEARSRGAQSELENVDNAGTAEKERIYAEARKKIEALKTADAAKIDGQLHDYESREDARIRKGVAQAQDGALLDLSGLKTFIGKSDCRLLGDETALGRAAVNNDPATGARSLKEIRATINVLEARIQSDVDRAVKSLAAKKGVKITYARDQKGILDATPKFTGMMRAYLLRAYRPVLSEASDL